jgi:lipopolysaccharide export system permease protein
MDTLDRFLIKEFVMYYIVIHLGLAALFLGVDFMSNFWDLHLTLPRVAELYGYKTPAALQQFFPMACLMATLMVLSSMSRQNEILALYVSGVGTLRLVSTLVATVAVISTISFLFFDSIAPVFNKRKIMLLKGLDPNTEEINSYQGGPIWYRNGNLVYNVGQFRAETNTIQDLNVYRISSNFEMREKIHAREATFEKNDWTLKDGFAVAYPWDTHFPVLTEFTVRRGVIPEKPGDFKTMNIQEETMRLRDLRLHINRNKASGLDTTAQRVSYHERVALVFTPLVFLLLGIPFALKPLKNHSMISSVGFCFMIVFAYLLIFRLSLSIGKGGHLPPVIAAWVPNTLFLAFAGFRITKRQ